jgi:selenide,water dikinase
MTRRLVLVGGGLAHLHVLHEWHRRPIADVDVVLVAPSAEWTYSGMVPGYLRGAYDARELSIDLEALSRCAHARLVTRAAERVTASERIVICGDEQIEFDLCSIDVGAAPAGLAVPGAANHVITLRPMSGVVVLRARLDALIAGDRPFAVAVVGAGIGGVEVALALHQRIVAGVGRGTVTLVDRGGTVLPGEGAALQQGVRDLMVGRGIGRVLGSEIAGVDASGVTLASGALVRADLVVWTTGAAPPPLLARSDLPVNDDGFLRIDEQLGAVGMAGVWGAGDCAAIAGLEGMPRSGVLALRQGPVLLQNLRAALGEGRPTRFRPPARTLAIVDTADGRAIARWGGWHVRSALAWRVKRWIDRRFVQRFTVRCDESAARPS